MEKLTTEIKLITPLIAKELLMLNEVNRPLREKHVADLSRDMLQKRWRELTGEPIKFSYKGKLIDGQHRLHAVIRTGLSFKFMFVYGLDPDVIDVLDSGVKRSAADNLRIHGIKNATVVSAIIHEVVPNGTKVTSMKSRVTNRAVMEKYEEDPELWDNITVNSQRWYNLFKAINTTLYGRSYYSVLKESKFPQKAIPFFDGLSSGKNCPDLIIDLRNKIMNDKIAKNIKMTKSAKMDLIRMYWNAYVKNRTSIRSEKSEGWL